MTRTVSEAIAQRHSCRAFSDKPVGEDMVKALINKAVRSPSGGNLQPWRIIGVTGETKDQLAGPAQQALMENPKGEDEGYPIYPSGLQEPYRSRRYKVGEDLYGALGIPREDKMGRMAWLAQNFTFFGAPVGLFFVTRKSFGHHQWAHMGMLMQSIALLAEEAGLATCMQEAWAMVRPVLRVAFEIEDDEIVYAGMALGYRDDTAVINQWRTERASADDVLTLRGFS